MEMVILVDHNDMAIGTMEKMEAHRKGELHRAFSIMVFNSKGEILLQKRAHHKYHSGGLWTNACCSHPIPGEKMEDATRRRLQEEMGIDLQPEFSYKFIYKTHLDMDLIEHEYDYVFRATFDGEPSINTEEVEDWKFANLNWLKADVQKHPEAYTYWFKLILDHLVMNSNDRGTCLHA
jgi:isopentenyl-diphosphate Delta-isomerase